MKINDLPQPLLPTFQIRCLVDVMILKAKDCPFTIFIEDEEADGDPIILIIEVSYLYSPNSRFISISDLYFEREEKN